MHYDVIIIGTGAGGGTLLHRLAPSGKSILVLERGGFLPREKDNWSPHAVLTESKYKAQETWFDAEGKAFHPGIHYYVGGQTKFYGAALLRMRERDFEEVRHADGISPAWPVGYAELEPYYTEAERLYRVHGERGSDPTEPWASAPYSHPAVSHEPRIQRLHDDLVRIGRKPFPLPMGVLLDERRPERSPCIRCETCDGFPCLVNAKSDAHVICVNPALKHQNVTLLTNALVTRLEVDGTGRDVRRVHVDRDGAKETYSADLVVVACGAVNSAALLLRSACDLHPRGLANRSGVVGRHYMCHNNSALIALSKDPNPTRFQKTLGLNDFYFGDDHYPFPMGHIAMLGKQDMESLRGGAPAFAPGIVLDAIGKHTLDFWLTTEDLPDPQNRVVLRDDGAIELRYRENNVEPHRRLTQKLKEMLEAIGCDHRHLIPHALYLGKKIPIAGVAHQCGTIRFGEDAERSALDRNGQAHDVENLFVADASVFPSSSAVNPALTIMAHALRLGDHILHRLGVSASSASSAEVAR